MTTQKVKPVWMARDAMLVDESASLKSTTDYGRFRLDLVNRPVSQKHVEELIEAINEKNLLREHPIIVLTDYTVYDGQHRLLAAQFLKVPIFFIVSDNMTIEDVAKANGLQKGWGTLDYMHHWLMAGNENYKQLHRFHDAYPFLPLAICRDLLWGAPGKKAPTFSFNAGEFVVDRPEYAETVGKILADFQSIVPAQVFRHHAFIRAVMNMAANPSYDHRRMIKKLEYLSVRMVKCADIKGYLTVLSSIYNHHMRASDIVEFKSVLRSERQEQRVRTNEA